MGMKPADSAYSLQNGRLAEESRLFPFSEFRTCDRQTCRYDAFADIVVHCQVALGVQHHGPDAVVVVFRPGGRCWSAPVWIIALDKCIHRRQDVTVLPCQQHVLCGELAAGEEKVTGLGG